jgi:hypothetical protein
MALSICPRLRAFAIIQAPSGSNSVVECDLAKVEVAGSNPVSRSRNAPAAAPRLTRRERSAALTSQGRGRQVVRPRSAKPLSAVRFRPAPPSFFHPIYVVEVPRCASGFRLRAQTPAKRLKFDSAPRLQRSIQPSAFSQSNFSFRPEGL